MIFYLANGTTLCPTQAEAKALDRSFVQHDIPTDKAGLMAYVQGLLDQIHTVDVLAQHGIVDEGDTSDIAPLPPPPQAKIDLLTRQQIEERWTDFPLSWRLDMHHIDLEEARRLAPRSTAQ